MSPEEKARLVIDEKLYQAGWVVQDMKDFNRYASLGVAVPFSDVGLISAESPTNHPLITH